MIFSMKKPKFYLFCFVFTAEFLLSFSLAVLAQETGNLGDTAPAEAPDAQWTGKADGMVEGTSGEGSGGMLNEVTDGLMGGMMNGGDSAGAESGTGTVGGTGTAGGTNDTRDTEAVTGDMATDTAASSSGSGSDDGMSVFGVVITIIIILAVAALIFALIPKRKMQ